MSFDEEFRVVRSKEKLTARAEEQTRQHLLSLAHRALTPALTNDFRTMGLDAAKLLREHGVPGRRLLRSHAQIGHITSQQRYYFMRAWSVGPGWLKRDGLWLAETNSTPAYMQGSGNQYYKYLSFESFRLRNGEPFPVVNGAETSEDWASPKALKQLLASGGDEFSRNAIIFTNFPNVQVKNGELVSVSANESPYLPTVETIHALVFSSVLRLTKFSQ